MAKHINPAADPAHKETDKLISTLTKKLRHTYSEAYGNAVEKFSAYMAAFEVKDKAHMADVAAGKWTEQEYTNWRRNQLLYADTLAGIRDTLAQDLHNVNKIAMKMVRDEQVDVYALNHNYGTYEVEHGLGVDTSFTLYDHDTVERLMKEDPALLPKPSVRRQAEIDAKDIAWNKQKLASTFTASILAGDDIPTMAKRISSVASMNQVAAIRNARTMCTGAENAGRQSSYERAQKMGIKLRKTWNSLRDGHVRESHIEADGQTVEIDEAYSLKYGELMYPGDASGPPAEVYNCRCFQTTQIDGFDFSKTSGEITEAPEFSNMSFDDWEEQKKIKIRSSESNSRSLEYIYNGRAGLNQHRQALYNKTPESGDWAECENDSVSDMDLAYLSAYTHHEYALWKGKKNSILHHGTRKSCDPDKELSDKLLQDHYEFVAHTHVDRGNLVESPEDRNTLKLLGQKKSKLIGIDGKVKEYGQSPFDNK